MSDLSMIYKVDTANAALPERYEQAKIALSELNDIDECKTWSDKAVALASYAKQAGDEELEKYSRRIRARAIRRCGELLKMFDGRGRPELNKDVSDPNLSKSDIGNQVGLSERQIKQANNLSNIPEDIFNNEIDSDNMPTLTKLSDLGKEKRDYAYQPKPEGFAEAIELKGYIQEVFELMKRHSPEFILKGMDDDDKAEMKSMIGRIEIWLDKFMVNV